MTKFFIAFLCTMVAACTSEVSDSEESKPATTEEAQTFGAPGFGSNDPQLVTVQPGDSTFYVVSTCTATTAQGLRNCYGSLIGMCKASGGIGIASKLKGSPDETGRYNISGKCVVRPEVPSAE